jgi:hypothetical protein
MKNQSEDEVVLFKAGNSECGTLLGLMWVHVQRLGLPGWTFRHQITGDIFFLATRRSAASKVQVQNPRCTHGEQARKSSHGKIHAIVRENIPTQLNTASTI